MTIKSYLNNNFNNFFFLFCLIILTAFYLFSCTPEPPKEIDEDFMEEYIERAEAKFRQDSIDKANENSN